MGLSKKLLNIAIWATRITRTANTANHDIRPVSSLKYILFRFLNHSYKKVLRDLSIKLIKWQPTSIKYGKLVPDSTPPANDTNTEALPVFTLPPWNKSLSLSNKILLLTCPRGHQPQAILDRPQSTLQTWTTEPFVMRLRKIVFQHCEAQSHWSPVWVTFNFYICTFFEAYMVYVVLEFCCRGVWSYI